MYINNKVDVITFVCFERDKDIKDIIKLINIILRIRNKPDRSQKQELTIGGTSKS